VIQPSLEDKKAESLFDPMILQWENFKIFANWLKKIMMWLDANTMKAQKTTLMNLAFEIFAKNLEPEPFMKGKLFDEVILVNIE